MKNLYSDLNKAAIDLIIQAYHDGAHDELELLGISIDVAEKLCNMPTRAYFTLGNFRGSVMSFSANNERLVLLIDHLEKETEKSHQIDQLIELGAPHNMLEKIAKLTRIEFQRRCKLLHGVKERRGRAKNLTQTESVQVNHVSNQIKAASPNLDDLTYFIELGRKTGIDLYRIWTFLNTENSDL